MSWVVKQRVRFVVEVAPEFSACDHRNTNTYRALMRSEGMRKALAVPSRMLEMAYHGSFMPNLTATKFEEERSSWGSWLVSGTREGHSLEMFFQRASVVSFKILPYIKNAGPCGYIDTNTHWGVGVEIKFKRNRELIGDLRLVFGSDGTLDSEEGTV